jgi:hypothetical protein
MPAVSAMDLEAEGILYEFEGSPVTLTAASVSNVGKKLSDALMVAPAVMKGGDTVYVLVRCDVTGIDHKPIVDDEGNWRRIHGMRCTDAVVVEVTERQRRTLDTTREKITKVKDAKVGVRQLFEDGQTVV